jgi:hypothetical protein
MILNYADFSLELIIQNAFNKTGKILGLFLI